MGFLREFWMKHRRKVFVAAGVLGSGYLAYKLYDAHNRSLVDLERELLNKRENEEISKAKMQELFKAIQRVADTVTLPDAIRELNNRLDEELSTSGVVDMLEKGKGTLSHSEKLGLWEEFKLLSFTRLATSLWAVTLLSLYIRVQVNILGRHLYIDTATDLGTSHLLEDATFIDSEDEKNFLSVADFLVIYGFPSLLSDMQKAVAEVLKGKQLNDFFNTAVFNETVMRILDIFVGTGNPYHWLNYLIPEDPSVYRRSTGYSIDSQTSMDTTKFDQLMMETREVLLSEDFANVVEISLKLALSTLVEDLEGQYEGCLSSGLPLAKLLPRLSRTVPSLTIDPSRNHYLKVIQSVPEVELFFTLLYSNMPASS